jgi:hypothetical protein
MKRSVSNFLKDNKQSFEYVFVVAIFVSCSLIGVFLISNIKGPNISSSSTSVNICNIGNYYLKDRDYDYYRNELDRIYYCYSNYFEKLPVSSRERGIYMYCDNFSWIRDERGHDMIAYNVRHIITKNTMYTNGSVIRDFREDVIRVNYCLYRWTICVINSKLYHQTLKNVSIDDITFCFLINL